MNILLNFFPVRAGGGQQVASNFLKIVAKNNMQHNWFLFVGDHSELFYLAESQYKRNKILAIPYSYTSRVTSSRKIKQFVEDNSIDLIYNYAPVLPIKGIPQVVRSVYSNLYFPEINFWEPYSRTTRLKKKIIDYYRLKGTLKADGLVFENESMRKRAINLFGYQSCLTIYIEPSVSLFDEESVNYQYDHLKLIKEFKILYLSSWHLNKNITLLPYVALCLKQQNVRVRFILSLDKADQNIREKLITVMETLKVCDYFEFIGKVNAIHVHQVVKSCDAMILLSKLECFSSNVIEAHYFGKPLIISDEEWAKSACQDSAIFVNRDVPKDISVKIKELIIKSDLREKLVRSGKERLHKFNSPEEKVFKQVKFLEYIYEKSKKRD